METVNIGIIGCGNISSAYMNNIPKFQGMKLMSCADIDLERAQKKAHEFAIPHAYTVEQLLADPSIHIVINLTIPLAHAGVCIQVLEAGKHVYVEKPLAVSREEGLQILELAKQKNLLVGCAPDTFLGGGIQTCRKWIDDGAIGVPIAATAFMMSGGHESWHPDPAFYYDLGGGPMFDMGPYYLTALITLLGPIHRVTGSAKISFKERKITSEPKAGQKIQVKTPTHIAGVIDFEQGAVATLVTSFDIQANTRLPHIEIYGSEGTLRVPDPNGFGGEVLLLRRGSKEWETVSHTHSYLDNGRGLGVADLVMSLRTGEAPRASGTLAYHVLEAMHGFHDASRDGKHYIMKSTCNQPAPLDPQFRF
jgi:predicted dehydrogenase